MNRFEALHALGLEEGASDEDVTMALYGLEKAAAEFDFSNIPPLQRRVERTLDKAREAKRFLFNAHNKASARQVESFGQSRRPKTRVTSLVEKQARLKGLEQVRLQVRMHLSGQQDTRRSSIIALLVCIAAGFVALRYVRLMMARMAIFGVLAVVAVVGSTTLTHAILTCRKLKVHLAGLDEAIDSRKRELGIDDAPAADPEEAPRLEAGTDGTADCDDRKD